MAERKLGDLTVGVQVDTSGLKAGLTGAEGACRASPPGKMGGAFSRRVGRARFRALLVKSPLSAVRWRQLVTPAGLATAAIGCCHKP